ncbi:MBL fold metallo-hydrolase [Ursidibacter sp. B-7004-1]
MSIALQCEFWAVGQGLFSSGKVLSGGNTAFSWVYDCGTSSDKGTLHKAIADMKKEYPNEMIDLLAISHFDIDHIKGIDELLKNRKVRYWLLPYYPQWQRLLIATMANITAEDDGLLDFYLNPVAYLITHYGDSLKDATILLVPAYQPKEPIVASDFNNEALFQTELPEEYRDFRNKHIELKSLKPNCAFIYDDVEFVPYNVPVTLLNPAISVTQLETQVENILKSSNSIQSKIQNLRTLYTRIFGSSSKQKNQISLFLYIRSLQDFSFHSVQHFQQPSTHCTQCNQISSMNWNGTKNAILYTGDGFLDTQNSFNLLQQALGHTRLQNIFCLQVMHHGSEHNCFIGLANQLQPCISVFSADNTRKNSKHPSPTIIQEFFAYNPILVNKTVTLKIR